MKQEYEKMDQSILWQELLPKTQIYSFDQEAPPMLTERMLRRRLEERQAGRQAILVMMAGVVTQLLLLVMMVLLYEYMPTVATIGMVYVLVSLLGGMATAAIYVGKRRAV